MSYKRQKIFVFPALHTRTKSSGPTALHLRADDLLGLLKALRSHFLGLLYTLLPCLMLMCQKRIGRFIRERWGMFDANMTYIEYNWLPSYLVGWSFTRVHSTGLRRYTPHYLADFLNLFSIFTGLLNIRWQ